MHPGSLPYFFTAEQGVFGHLSAFLIQSTDDLHHRLLGEMTNADKSTHPQQTSVSGSGFGLIRKSGFDSRIIFGSNFGVDGGLRSLSAFVIDVVIIIAVLLYE